jgi:hypothetical protein
MQDLRETMQACKKRLMDYYSSQTNGSVGGIALATTNAAKHAAMGALTFGTVSAVSCWSQWQCMGISTGTAAPIPTLIGVVTVCVASVASHVVVVHAVHYGAAVQQPTLYHQQRRYNAFSLSKEEQKKDSLFLGPVQIPMHTIRMYVDSPIPVGCFCFSDT